MLEDMEAAGKSAGAIPKVRRKRGEERIKALIAATDAVLCEQELETVSLQIIAERAGVPTSSVYHFFPNREAAFTAVARMHLDVFYEMMGKMLDRHPETWQGYVGTRIRLTAEYMNSHRGALRLLFGRHFTEDLHQDNTRSFLAFSQERVKVMNTYFLMPDIEGLAEKLAMGSVISDAILSISFASHRQITEEYIQEAVRATIAYLRLYLPEIIPARALPG